MPGARRAARRDRAPAPGLLMAAVQAAFGVDHLVTRRDQIRVIERISISFYARRTYQNVALLSSWSIAFVNLDEHAERGSVSSDKAPGARVPAKLVGILVAHRAACARPEQIIARSFGQPCELAYGSCLRRPAPASCPAATMVLPA